MERTAADATATHQQVVALQLDLHARNGTGRWRALERIESAEIENARAQRTALESKSEYEAIFEAKRLERVVVIDAAAAVVRQVIETGRQFLRALQIGAEIDQMQQETRTPDQRWANSMIPNGGAFPHLQLVSVDMLVDRLDRLVQSHETLTADTE